MMDTAPRNTMLVHDATSGLKTLPNESVDLIVTDPAYDTLEKWRGMGTTTRLKNSKSSSNAWFPTVDKTYFKEFLEECYRVLRKKTHIYIMCDDEMSYHLRPMVEEAGFTWRKKIIWHKVGKLEYVNCPDCGAHVTEQRRPGAPGMGYPYRSCYECIILAHKGKRGAPENRSVRDVLKAYYGGDPEWEDFKFYEDFVDNLPDVLEVRKLKGKQYYPTEKPVELLKALIGQSSDPGDLVCDPFAGSGSTLLAARELGRDYLGFDVTESAVAWFEHLTLGTSKPDLTDRFEPPKKARETDVLDMLMMKEP